MARNQANDEQLLKEVEKLIQQGKQKYTWKEVEGVDIIYCEGKILVPSASQDQVLDWYHKLLVHPGMHQIYETIKLSFYWPGLKKDVKTFIK